MTTLHIAAMLRGKRHLSFHTPGHKKTGGDITELSYSDDLYDPRGGIAAAERDIAEILGAKESRILTDGSTAGVFSMIGALKDSGVKTLAFPAFSHPSVYHACDVLSVKKELIPARRERGIPKQPNAEEITSALSRADALLLTSPDYYGYFAPLSSAKALCEEAGKPLVVDGAHGSHLHGRKEHPSNFASLWVDGVHKSLPALTQGAVVSAAAGWEDLLLQNVRKFRTSSPSYPIMASVEYAVKYPQNLALELAAEEFKRAHGCENNDDWSKLLLFFGERAEEAQSLLEKKRIFPEFNDGNYLMFYLSPATRLRDLKRLGRIVDALPRGEQIGKSRLFCYPEDV